MRNNLLSVSLLLLLLSISLYAQPEHGNYILGETINYSTNKTQDYPSDQNYSADQTVKQFMFSPSLGYFPSYPFMYDLAMGYTESNTEYKQNNDSYLISYSSNLFFISPFFKFYNFLIV